MRSFEESHLIEWSWSGISAVDDHHCKRYNQQSTHTGQSGWQKNNQRKCTVRNIRPRQSDQSVTNSKRRKKVKLNPKMVCHRSLFGLFLIHIIFARNYVQSSGFGRCPKYPSMPKFNMTKVIIIANRASHSIIILTSVS